MKKSLVYIAIITSLTTLPAAFATTPPTESIRTVEDGFNYTRYNKALKIEEFISSGKKGTGTLIKYNKAGKKIEESTYINGVKEGKETGYLAYNGNKERESYYVNDKKEGIETLFNAYAKKEEKSTESFYINGIKEGIETTFSYNHLTKINYINGLKEGPLTAYGCPKGKNTVVVNYVNDKKEGQETILYCHSGKKQKQYQYVNGMKNGPFFESRTQKDKSNQYITSNTEGIYANDLLEGEVVTSATDSTVTTTRYIHGKKEGLETSVNIKNKQRTESTYKDGKKEGLEIIIDKNQYKTELKYKSGMATSYFKKYYPSGKIYQEKVLDGNRPTFEVFGMKMVKKNPKYL